MFALVWTLIPALVLVLIEHNVAQANPADPKVALVTGSSSGIGEATVKLLVQKGYKVAITGSNSEKVDRVANDCVQLSPQKFQPLTMVLDLINPENGRVAVEKTIEHFGRLDVLVSNAGIPGISETEDPKAYETYRKIMTINTDAAVQAALAAAEELKRTRGNMVFISSVAAVQPSERSYAYSMSKAALTMFAKCLAIDLAPKVRVNIVAPGPIVTPIFDRVGISADAARASLGTTTLLGRAGESSEIAEAIAFLISENAAFITGHELVIDGGYLIKPDVWIHQE